LALFGVGAVGLGLGTYFGLRAISKNDQAEAHCPNTPLCNNDRGVALTDEAQTAALVSNIAFGVGAAALAGGLIIHLTSSDEPASASLPSFTLKPLVGGGHASFTGSF
jgi:serine/threonine-protein kinase